MKIVIYGFMMSGKTTTATLVSSILSLKHYDTDEIFEKKFRKKIKDYIAEKGILRFRKEEKKIFKSLLDKTKDAVISAGGGIFPTGRKDIIEIFLNVPYYVVEKRFEKGKETRPLLNKKKAQIKKLYLSRLKYYRRAKFIIKEKNCFKAAEKIVKIYYDEKENTDKK